MIGKVLETICIEAEKNDWKLETGKCNYFWVEKEKEGPIIEEVRLK